MPFDPEDLAYAIDQSERWALSPSGENVTSSYPLEEIDKLLDITRAAIEKNAINPPKLEDEWKRYVPGPVADQERRRRVLHQIRDTIIDVYVVPTESEMDRALARLIFGMES